jgi:hypothetical protein
MQIITPFDPSAATQGYIQTGLVNRCAILYLINESQIGLKLMFGDGSTAILPPWYARAYYLNVPNAPVKWEQIASYNTGAGTAPFSLVTGEGYEPNEAEGIVFSQGPLARQLNIGNSLNVSTSTTQVINDGSAANTQVVEATQTGASSSNVVIENDGTVIIREGTTTLVDLLKIIPGAVTALILGAATRATQIVGDLLISTGKIGMTTAGDILDAVTLTELRLKAPGGGDIVLQSPGGTEVGRVTNAGNLRVPGGKIGDTTDGDIIDASSATATFIKARSAGNITFETPNGTAQALINSNGLRVHEGKIWVQNPGDLIDANATSFTYIKTRASGGAINFQVPDGTTRVSINDSKLVFNGTGIQWKTGDTLSVTHTFTGTGTGTYSHGTGATPFIVLPVCTIAGSMTVGYDSANATTVHITCGAGLNFKALTMVG